ncbi:potassium-transporting ATPase subunit F [Rhodobacter veldkampii DSM 11550]|uniref:K(+)-transporting ATPase subunit F n=1 Tax=Phaeovulum veldkampii TaxID=33049 RepID=UPI001A929ED7|nr:potassium-transporting ATPase subunit F [Phaeovulum veldkampii DSM 11550]
MTFSTFSSASKFLQPAPPASAPSIGCEGGAIFDLILGLAVEAGLFVYLGAALLRPDRC